MYECRHKDSDKILDLVTGKAILEVIANMW